MVDDPSKRHLRRNPKSVFPGGLQKLPVSWVFFENPDLLEMCFWFFELFECWKSFGWVLVLVQTTSEVESGIFPSTLFGFLSVIIVVIHECK